MTKSHLNKCGAVLEDNHHFTLFHICFANHSEVLFRKEVDYITFINIIATESDKQDVAVRVYACMSDHVHLAVYAKNIASFTSNIIRRYTHYFNQFYKRRGSLIDDDVFISKILGPNHEQAVYSYIIRNPRHHDVCESALGYGFSSGKYYFSEAFGRDFPAVYLSSAKALISHRYDVPQNCRVLPGGMINPADWLDIAGVERVFGTFKNFSYNISHRKSNEDWLREQRDDAKYFQGEVFEDVTLYTVEPFYRNDTQKMISTEIFSYKETGKSDLAVCSIIDNNIVSRFGVSSFYALTTEQKRACRKILRNEFNVFNESQICRCAPF